MGNLANQAQKEAMGIVSGERKAARQGERAEQCPRISYESCPGLISESKKSTFDYWVNLNSQWGNKIRIPAKSHWRLNDKILHGWELSRHCQFFKTKSGRWFVRVFVTREVVKPKPKDKFLGVDVGIRHGATRSDGYLGPSLLPTIHLEKQRQAERQRQKHPKKPFRTILKQQLDREVNLALGRSRRNLLGIAVEHPKTLANLRMGKLGRWAKGHFAVRLHDRALEEGAFVIWVNPASTSITCSGCGFKDKRSRVKQDTFICVSCGNVLHADINASVNLARKGRERVAKLLDKVPLNSQKGE
jgi:transposase